MKVRAICREEGVPHGWRANEPLIREVGDELVV
jgi:hypothetical protein